MGKRAAGNAPRQTKSAKVEDEQSILSQLLSGERGMSPDCKAMIQNSAPYAFATPPSDRHAFQQQVIDGINKLCTDRETEHQAQVDAARAEIATVDAKRKTADEELELARGRANEKAAVKDAKVARVSDLKNIIAAATANLEAVRAKSAKLNEDLEAAEKEKAEHEDVITSAWEPLKNYEVQGIRRKNNKVLDRMTSTLTKCDAPPSLIIAVTVGLRQKVDQREKFATRALDAADVVLKEHTLSLQSKIAALEASIAASPAEEETAMAALTVEEEKWDSAQKEQVACENEWVDQDSVAFKAQEQIDALGFEAESAAKKLSKAESTLAGFMELKSKIEAKRDHRPLIKDDDEMQDEGTEACTPMKATPTKAQSP